MYKYQKILDLSILNILVLMILRFNPMNQLMKNFINKDRNLLREIMVSLFANLDYLIHIKENIYFMMSFYNMFKLELEIYLRLSQKNKKLIIE